MILVMRVERPFQAIWTPMQKRMKAMTRRMPCAVDWRDGPGQPGGVGVAEVTQHAEDNDGQEDSDMREDALRERAIGDVRAEGEHADQYAGS